MTRVNRRFATLHCVLFHLVLFVSFAIAVALLGASSAVAAEYRIITDSQFTSSRPHTPVYSLKATSDGGYLILGKGATNELRLIRLTERGELKWERIIAARRLAEYRPTFAVESEDGGFWLVGLVSEFEFTPEVDVEEIFKSDRDRFHRFRVVPFLAKFDANGKLAWRNPLGRSELFRQSTFLCGVRTEEGLFLVGTKYHSYADQPPRGNNAIIVHPWIASLKSNGELIWERLIVGDSQYMFNAVTTFNASDCAGPYLEPDGTATFGIKTFSYPTFWKDAVRIVAGPGTQDKGAYSYLALRIASDGKERSRTLMQGHARGVLLRSKSGYLLVTNPEPWLISALRLTELDGQLSTQRSSDAAVPGHYLTIFGAQASRGGVHVSGNLVGRDGSPKGRVLAHVATTGEINALRPLPSDWSLDAHVSGRHADEIAVVLRRDSTAGSAVRFMRFNGRGEGGAWLDR